MKQIITLNLIVALLALSGCGVIENINLGTDEAPRIDGIWLLTPQGHTEFSSEEALDFPGPIIEIRNGIVHVANEGERDYSDISFFKALMQERTMSCSILRENGKNFFRVSPNDIDYQSIGEIDRVTTRTMTIYGEDLTIGSFSSFRRKHTFLKITENTKDLILDRRSSR